MKKDMTIAYEIEDSLYLNITNQCTNDCLFCIRRTKEGMGYDLWLPQEPTLEEVLNAIDHPTAYKEIVFCGYGEPLIRYQLVVAAAIELKKRGAKKIRINTNGQANLIHQKNIVPKLAGLIDIISISLNAQNAHFYQTICCPINFSADEAFQGVLEFAQESKKYIPTVVLSVVQWPGLDIPACEKIARDLEVNLKVRELIGSL